MKPIETRYAGCRFRSRLEARWAVFFDEMGIEWMYEPDPFPLSTGGGYLPDFLLPTFDGGMYVEVKPPSGDFTKAIQFAIDSGSQVWMAEGTPSFRAYRVYFAGGNFGERGRVDWYWGIPNTSSARDENRMYACPENIDEETGDPHEWWFDDDYGWVDPRYAAAVESALSARFEPRRPNPGFTRAGDVISGTADGVLGSVRRLREIQRAKQPRQEGTETA